jgi:DNA-binding MarR family transcriptional regulator
MTTDPTLTDSELVSRLERTLHALSKRVYSPTIRALYAALEPHSGSTISEKLDKGSIIVLATLDERGQLRLSDLAAVVDLDLSTVSRHVSYFEQLGLIERATDPGDRRASLVSITDRGRAGLTAIRGARTVLLDSVFSSWSSDDRREFHRLLGRLQTDVAALPGPGTAVTPSTAMTAKTEIPA